MARTWQSSCFVFFLLVLALIAVPVNAAEVDLNPTLGTNISLSEVKKVLLYPDGPSEMFVSFWPKFRFPAPQTSKADYGTLEILDDQKVYVKFDTKKTKHTGVALGAKFGAKLLSWLRFPTLSIEPSKFEGTINVVTGEVDFHLLAKLHYGWFIQMPPLTIDTRMVTGDAKIHSIKTKGQPLSDGGCILVAASEIPKTGFALADWLLALPTGAAVIMPTRIEFLAK